MDYEMERIDMSDERTKELSERWKSADMTVRKSADIAFLLISEEAEVVIKKMITDIDGAHHPNAMYMDVLDEQYAAINTALEKMVKLAALDVKRRVWWRLA